MHVMHIDIYGSVKGGINSIIMKGNGTRRKNVNPINRISGFVCFFFWGRCPLDPCPLNHRKGHCPLDPTRGATP